MKKILVIILLSQLILINGCDSNVFSNYTKIFLKKDQEPVKEIIDDIVLDTLSTDSLEYKKTNVLLPSPPPPPPPPPPPIDIEYIVEDEEEIENEFEMEDTDSDEDEEIIIEENEEEFFMVVENMPEFPGGDLGLMKYIKTNIKYPAIAKEYNITGKVYVSYIIDKDGSVTNVKIVRGVDTSLDEEALRVVKSLPKYTPGRQRGRPVRVMFTIPINFNLN